MAVMKNESAEPFVEMKKTIPNLNIKFFSVMHRHKGELVHTTMVALLIQ